MAALTVEDVHTYYGESHILHGVSLRVDPGEAVALLGRNGAGKTTVIRSIAGFTPPRHGRIALDGEAIQSWPPHRIARRGLALVPQGRRIFAPLSVRENLLLGARAAGWTLERVFDVFPRLRERQEQAG
ncbi:MAG TPA: ATP-binding cassette domain-containing protein, partial [Candidatus Methylomirabilis sp.]|nr:ATP-binding cassette domain-containing protein [Candidatus Methylomirabilis sp.]